MKKRVLIVLLTLALMLPFIETAAVEKEEAEDFTRFCQFDMGAYSSAESIVRNRYLQSRQTFQPGEAFSVFWEDNVPAHSLCLQWYEFPEDVTIFQYAADGRILKEETAETHSETITKLEKDTCRVQIRAGESGMCVSRCCVFGVGVLPEPFYEWQETPERLDYLLIATHPDDDVLYLGSVVPYYGAERGYVGTIVYVTHQSRLRITEAQNGAWTMGLRYRPIFLGYPCLGPKVSDAVKKTFDYPTLLLDTVRIYRRYHPLVVFAQDRDGEYGHWQHVLTSAAAVEAFTLAADPSYDPDSAEQYGTWQVQKVFLHLYPENTIQIDASEPLSFFDGKTAFEVAERAYRKHESQNKQLSLYVQKDNYRYAFNRFGMAIGAVKAGDGVFDNIDASLFSFYTPPTAPPTTTPPTAPPTTTPPTAPPATVPPTAPPTPEPTTELSVQLSESSMPRNRVILISAAVALVLVIAVFLSFRMKKKSR